MKHICIPILFFIFFSFSATKSTFGQQKGGISGKIIDARTGEEIIGAGIGVKGTSIGTLSDLDGKYFLNLPEGTYDLQIVYVSYESKEIKNVSVLAGKTIFLNISMAESVNELQEVVVATDAGNRKESEAVLLLQQKNAVSMSSGISAELIRKMPDRTTADVIKRVAGASVQDGKFAIIRGLGDRYNYGLINDVPLPSSESDRKAFSLDMIPSQIVDNLTISKTATPDMPGDFAGGLIQINTRGIPDENVRFVNVGIGGHSLTTFKDFNYSPDASSTDWLGFDNNKRNLSSATLSTGQAKALDINKDAGTITEQSKLLNNNFSPNSKTAGLNYQFQLGASQRFKLFKNDVGVIGALTYSNSLRYAPATLNTNITFPANVNTNSQINYVNNLNVDNYKNTVNVGGILNFAFKLGLKNKFTFKNLFTQNSEDQTFYRTGLNKNSGGYSDSLNQKDYGYYYSSSRMLSSQIGGEHVFGAKNFKLKYSIGYNNLNKNVPSYKRLFYQNSGKVADNLSDNPFNAQLSADPAGYLPNNSGVFYAQLNEQSGSLGYDLTLPFIFLGKQELKLGGMHQIRVRDFTARNFNYGYTTSSNLNSILLIDSLKTLGPGSIFANQNISAPGIFYSRETTQKSDQYTASSLYNAGFLMFDSRFTTKLRVVWGLRLEAFNQKLSSPDLQKPVDTTWVDPLPSANIIYSLTDKINLRASYARTVSRPEFREFAPLGFYEFSMNSIFVGNPKLNRSTIHNADVKFEIYPTAGSFFAITPFYKYFYSPIITVRDGGNTIYDTYNYSNAKSAVNYGIEIEGRTKLSAFAKPWEGTVLDKLTVFANVAFINSMLDVSNIEAFNGTDINNIPLTGQSPFVFNSGLQFEDQKTGLDFTVMGNLVGRRLAYVGRNSNKESIWENPRFVLDMSVSKTINKFMVRLIASDLLAQDLVFYYDLNQNGSYDSNSDLAAFKYKNGQRFVLQCICNF